MEHGTFVEINIYELIIMDMLRMYMNDDTLINEQLIRKEIRMWRFEK